MRKIPFLLSLLFFGLLAGCVQMPEEQHTSFETLSLARENVTAPVSWSASIRGKGDVSIVSRCTGVRFAPLNGEAMTQVLAAHGVPE